MKYNVLIIGSDANAYYMARCYHEAYHKKAYVLAKGELPYTKYSNILNIFYDFSIWDEEGFLRAIYKFKEEHNNYKTLLISSNESYARMIAKNKEQLLKDNFIFNYPSLDIIDSLMMKETFYKKYQDSCLSLPETYYFDCSKDKVINKKMKYPLILKPSNVIMYNHLSFEGKNKIYQIYSKKELDEVIKRIVDAGYTDTLIIQDFIPGDDTYLFDAVAYVSSEHQVKLLSLARIGLQEHSKNMVGNAAVLINGYTEGIDTKEIEEEMKTFLEDIKYQGFCEFDLKYDERDSKFKVLEINSRQGRSSYYMSAAGCNLIEILKRDLIDKEALDFEVIDKEVMLSFIPRGIVKKYIVNDEFKAKALSLWKNHVNPMKYNKDSNLKRNYFLLRRDIKYFKDYKNGYWKNS